MQVLGSPYAVAQRTGARSSSSSSSSSSAHSLIPLHIVCSSLPRLPYVRPCASIRPDTHIGDAQRDAAAAQAPASSRRQALGLLAGATLALSAARDLATPAPAPAALKDYRLDPNDPIEEVAVQLGTEDGEFIFTPNTLELTAGKIYKLKLRNPSAVTHYFTAFEFAEKSFSIMVLAGDPVVEVKGGIQEVALKAGASATWVIMPVKPGTYPLRCTVKGHDAMRGQIVVRRAAAAAAQ